MNIPILLSWALIGLTFSAHAEQIHKCTNRSGNITYSDVHCVDQGDVLDAFLQNPAGVVGTTTELTRQEHNFLQQREKEKQQRQDKAARKREKYKREFQAKKQACIRARDNIHQKRHVKLSHAQRWTLRMQVHDKC